MIDIVSKEDCVGCKACGDICPVNAITYEIDDEGFWFPKIDSERCVHCEKCSSACPVICKPKRLELNDSEPQGFGVYHNNKNVRYNSTSGGMYYALGELILSKGGYLVGCEFNDDYTAAIHTVENTENGLKKLMRTKYFQSDTEGIFKETENLLKDQKIVLFCGAPCQVGALYNFLGKEYDNLYTVDFICRGINTPYVYNKYMEELKCKYKSEIKEVHFKDKSKGWTTLGTRVRFKNGKEYYRNKDNDPWVNAFNIAYLYARKGCSNCRFKGFPRPADISFGDFWGPKWYPEFSDEDNYFGVSAALANNEKGKCLIESATEYMKIWTVDYKKIVEGNGALIQTFPQNPRRDEFFERIKKEPYSRVVWDIMGMKAPKRQLINAYKSMLLFIRAHMPEPLMNIYRSIRYKQ